MKRGPLTFTIPEDRIVTPREYPPGVNVFYVLEHVANNTHRLIRHVRGRLPKGYFETSRSHLRWIEPGWTMEMLCAHPGRMDDCIERADEILHDIYVSDDPVWLKQVQRELRKKEKAPISLAPRSLYVADVA